MGGCQVTDNSTPSLRDSLHACRDLFATAAIFAMGLNLLYLAPSLYMMQVYDRVLTTGGITTLAFVSIVLAGALAALAWLDAERSRLLTRIGLRLERKLAPALIEAAAQRDTRSDPARINLMREFDTLRQTISGPAATAVMDAPWSPVFILVSAIIHPFLGLAVFAGGLALLLLAYISERNQRRRLSELAAATPMAYAATDAESAAAGTARAIGMRQALISRAVARRTHLNTLQAQSAFTATRFTAITKFLRLGLQSGVLGLGAWLAVERQISPGAMIAVSILASRALSPLEQIVGAWRQIGQSLNSYQRIEAVLANSPNPQQHTKFAAPSGRLRLEDVTVSLPGAATPTLTRVSFEVAPGEILAVVGPSGAGKSTLARAALGIVKPSEGAVRIDGANIADWNPDELGRSVGYVPQEIHLVAGSIAENIRRLTPRTSENAATIDADTISAATLTGAHELILRLPKAYETTLGLGGAGLSAGQAQRIALARAFFREPSLIILDEPNAHLDNEGDIALNSALRAAKDRGAAIIIITHRTGLLAQADRVLVLTEGHVRRLGSREAIIADQTPRLAVVPPPSRQESPA
jgi:ATP-binding cassette subfamily C protein